MYGMIYFYLAWFITNTLMPYLWPNKFLQIFMNTRAQLVDCRPGWFIYVFLLNYPLRHFIVGDIDLKPNLLCSWNIWKPHTSKTPEKYEYCYTWLQNYDENIKGQILGIWYVSFRNKLWKWLKHLKTNLNLKSYLILFYYVYFS